MIEKQKLYTQNFHGQKKDEVGGFKYACRHMVDDTYIKILHFFKVQNYKFSTAF